MKKAIATYLTISIAILLSQDNDSSLQGEWVFESMTTITKAAREEITIVYKDKNNVETLTFSNSGSILYNVLNEGIQKTGRGVWYSDESYVTIIVESDTTYGTYGIEDGSLTIITTEEESDEYYGYSTILKYSKQ